MKQLLFILALGPALAFGSIDPTGAAIESNGWILDIYFSNTTSNGLFNFAMNTNNVVVGGLSNPYYTPGSGTPAITLLSQGYNNAGTLGVITRTVYGTKELRYPYNTGGQTTGNYVDDETVSGTGIKCRIALSDWVFQNDSNLTLVVTSGLYSNCTAATLTVTNSSTMQYSSCKPVANWTCVNWDRISSTSWTLRAKAYHRFGQAGSPVACMVFRAVDQHTHTNTVTVTSMSVSTDGPVPIQEYVATMDASGLTAQDIIACDFLAYPWVGDSTAVTDTSDGVNSELTPYYHTQRWLNDKNGAYCTAIALVNQATGSSASTVIVHTNGTIPTKAFASINQAANAIVLTNNAKFGHNDSGGGIIYIQGTNSFSGTSASAATTRGSTWLLITNFPGDTTSAIVDGTGPGNVNSLTKCGGITIQDNDNGSFVFSAISNIWWDHCTIRITNSSADYIDGAGLYYLTDNTVYADDQGFIQQGSQNQTFALGRGNTMNGFCNPWHGYTMVGNLKTVTNLSGQINSLQSGINFPMQGSIVADNRLLNQMYAGSSTYWSFGGSTLNISNGTAIVNNIIEVASTNLPGIACFVHGDSTTGNSTNVILWHNTFLGERSNLAYNDLGAAAAYTVLWSMKNNVLDNRAIKSDTFSGNSLNGARIGNWSLLYGVGCSDNTMVEKTNMPAPGSFMCEFPGFNSIQPQFTGLSQPRNGTANVTTFAQWTTDGSQLGQANQGSGNGDYHPKTTAPMTFPLSEWLLPFDIEGYCHGALDPAGSYSAASPRKGGGFFGQ